MRINLLLFSFKNFNIKSNNKPNKSINNQTQNLDLFDSYNALLNRTLINFKGKEKSFSSEIEKLIEKGDENELFEYISSQLRKKAQEKKINANIIDDVIQNAIVEILLLFQDFSDDKLSKKELLDKINEIYEKIKPKKGDYVSDFKTVSLETPILDGDKTLIDTIADDKKHRISYLSNPDDETKEKFKKLASLALDGVELDDREKDVLSGRFNNERKETFQTIANRHEIAITTMFLAFKRVIYKIQVKNNSLPDDIKQNILDTVELFKDEGLTYEQYLEACLAQPYLFIQLPKDTEKKVRDLVEKFEKEGLTVKDYLNKACLKQPQLFYQSPNTVEKKVRDLVEKFKKEGLTIEKYLPACLKQPQLFYQSPNTVEKKVRDLVGKFEKEGLTVEKYLPACLKQPQLFCQLPETIESNVRDLVKAFEKEGLTVEKYLIACLKQPQLFSRSPNGIENNVRDLVKAFEKEGLTVEKYLIACLKQSSLFYQSPKTIENNVRDLVEVFEKEGLTVEKYLIACLKVPQLFHQSPETIENNVRANMFVKKNRYKNLSSAEVLKKVLISPSKLTKKNETNYAPLLRRKMFGWGNIPKTVLGDGQVNQKLINYLKENPNSKFSFDIIDDPMSTDFIEYAKNLGIVAVGRDDVFDIKIA